MANATARTVHFGLIGYGLFGAHHAAAISKTPDVELTGIAVKSEKSQEAARTAFPGCAVYGDWRTLLDRPDIDLVDIVVPNHLHFEIAQAALEAGKAVLVEKPLALEASHCDELVRLANQKGLLLAVNHELRLSSLWGSAKRLIDEGAIGRPLYALIELSRFPYRLGAEGWRYDLDRVGNWILEEPIHFFDLARWYLAPWGEPVSIYARANSRQEGHPELHDNFSAILNFSNGAYAVVSQTLAAFEHHVIAKVTGTKGTLWARWSAPDARSDRCTFSLRYGLGQDIHDVPLDKPAGELLELADQIAAVAECVRSGAAPPCTGNDGRWSARICLAAEQSARTGRIVDLQNVVSSGAGR